MLKKLLATLVVTTTISAVAALPALAAWNDPACAGLNEAQRAAAGCTENRNLQSVATNILDVIISLVGLVSVIFIIVGGIQYATSSGDPAKAQKARRTILYSIIGLIVTLLAFAIVHFVLAAINT